LLPDKSAYKSVPVRIKIGDHRNQRKLEYQYIEFNKNEEINKNATKDQYKYEGGYQNNRIYPLSHEFNYFEINDYKFGQIKEKNGETSGK